MHSLITATLTLHAALTLHATLPPQSALIHQLMPSFNLRSCPCIFLSVIIQDKLKMLINSLSSTHFVDSILPPPTTLMHPPLPFYNKHYTHCILASQNHTLWLFPTCCHPPCHKLEAGHMGALQQWVQPLVLCMMDIKPHSGNSMLCVDDRVKLVFLGISQGSIHDIESGVEHQRCMSDQAKQV